jgi:hypothetical protein
MTEQIYYSMWGSESDEHKDYFYTIGTIANWIGYALIGPRHSPYTTEIMPLSNIGNTCKQKKSLEVQESMCRSQKKHIYKTQNITDKFIKQQSNLFPQYEKAIRDGMDYTTYMFDTEEELTKYTNTQIEWSERVRDGGEVDDDWFEERMQMIRETDSFLKKVCLFT